MKLYPVTVTVVLRAFHTAPTSRTAFGAEEIVTVVATEVAGAYVVAAALYAVTVHVPPDLAVSTPVVDIAQPVAVPFVTVYVTAPVPVPPAVASVRGTSR
jgi:hypothetical protein